MLQDYLLKIFFFQSLKLCFYELVNYAAKKATRYNLASKTQVRTGYRTWIRRPAGPGHANQRLEC